MPFQQDFYGEAPNNPAEKRLNTNYQLKEAPMAPATGVLALNPAPRLPETKRFSATTTYTAIILRTQDLFPSRYFFPCLNSILTEVWGTASSRFLGMGLPDLMQIP